MILSWLSAGQETRVTSRPFHSRRGRSTNGSRALDVNVNVNANTPGPLFLFSTLHGCILLVRTRVKTDFRHVNFSVGTAAGLALIVHQSVLHRVQLALYTYHFLATSVVAIEAIAASYASLKGLRAIGDIIWTESWSALVSRCFFFHCLQHFLLDQGQN